MVTPRGRCIALILLREMLATDSELGHAHGIRFRAKREDVGPRVQCRPVRHIVRIRFRPKREDLAPVEHAGWARRGIAHGAGAKMPRPPPAGTRSQKRRRRPIAPSPAERQKQAGPSPLQGLPNRSRESLVGRQQQAGATAQPGLVATADSEDRAASRPPRPIPPTARAAHRARPQDGHAPPTTRRRAPRHDTSRDQRGLPRLPPCALHAPQ